MNLIKITPLVKKRVRVLIADLLPEFKYIRTSNQGLVMLKKKWWSFKKTTINITDLFIDILPKKLSDSCKRKGYGDTYERIFSDDIYIMMQLKSYKKDVDIVEYIWNKYNVLHREVPVIRIMTDSYLLEDPSSIYLPVLSPVSSYFIPGIEKLLAKRKGTVDSLIEKISKIQKRGPQWLVRVKELTIGPGVHTITLATA
jgi:hypothetical protein